MSFYIEDIHPASRHHSVRHGLINRRIKVRRIDSGLSCTPKEYQGVEFVIPDTNAEYYCNAMKLRWEDY